MYAYPDNPTIKPQYSVSLRDKQTGLRGFLFGGLMRICSIEGCEKEVKARGYCGKHYYRFKQYDDPLIFKNEKHGKYGTPEYWTWHDMKARCLNAKDTAYKNYGARGIKICDKWKKSFTAFYEDMGEKPFPKAQIDRINNDNDYEPKNCRWTTNKENSRDRRTTKLSLTKAKEIKKLYGTTNYTLKKLACIYNVSISMIWDIIAERKWI